MPAVLMGKPGVGVALFTGSNDNPLYDPYNNLPALSFHSGLQYPVVNQIITASITLPFRAGESSAVHNLVAHGRGDYPLVLGGRITAINGVAQDFPIACSFPLELQRRGHGRILSLAVNQTYILVHEDWMYRAGGSAAITVDFEIYLCNLLVGSTPPSGVPSVLAELDGPVFKCADGRFDSRLGYIRKSGTVESGTKMFPLPRGKTVDIKTTTAPQPGWGYRYSLAGVVKAADRYTYFETGDERTGDCSSGSFDAAYDWVKFNTPNLTEAYTAEGSPNRIVIRNAAGVAVFDTDESMFHGQWITGSVVLPRRTAPGVQSSNNQWEVVTEIQDINPNFNVVLGMFSPVDDGDGAGDMGNTGHGIGYFLAGGTYHRTWHMTFDSPPIYPRCRSMASFYAEGGKLKILESTFLGGGTIATAMSRTRLNYKLFVGGFT